MAADQGKSSFVRELLQRDSEANQQAVNEAWQAAGNEGTISNSLVSKIRSDMGLTGKRGSRNGAVAGGEAPKRTPKRATGTRGRKAEQANGPEAEIGPSGAPSATQAEDQGMTGAEDQD